MRRLHIGVAGCNATTVMSLSCHRYKILLSFGSSILKCTPRRGIPWANGGNIFPSSPPNTTPTLERALAALFLVSNSFIFIWLAELCPTLSSACPLLTGRLIATQIVCGWVGLSSYGGSLLASVKVRGPKNLDRFIDDRCPARTNSKIAIAQAGPTPDREVSTSTDVRMQRFTNWEQCRFYSGSS